MATPMTPHHRPTEPGGNPTVSPVHAVSFATLLSPLWIARRLWLYRELIVQLTTREITQRYRGAYLGFLWPFLTPLFMLLIYTFVFSIVFQARWGHLNESQDLVQFALTLFAGLVPFTLFSEVVNGAPGLILAVPNYVKKVVFPLEIFPVIILGSALFHSLISIGILLTGVAIWQQSLSPMVMLLPLAYLPLILLVLGLGWFLASLGVYVRDMQHSMALIVQILFFMSPIFYPVSAVPERFRLILYLNPLTTILDGFRRILLWQQPLSWPLWAMWSAISLAVAVLGFAWFIKTKDGFADVV
jgi:lipopolysaccharide transport system permease protein